MRLVTVARYSCCGRFLLLLLFFRSVVSSLWLNGLGRIGELWCVVLCAPCRCEAAGRWPGRLARCQSPPIVCGCLVHSVSGATGLTNGKTLFRTDNGKETITQAMSQCRFEPVSQLSIIVIHWRKKEERQAWCI